jgi:hypothetical protein
MTCPECSAPLEPNVVATAGDHVAAEIDYNCPTHGIQAFWAYGSFDPSYPVWE